MTEDDYPKEVTQDNIQLLSKKAEKIKEEYMSLRRIFLIVFLYFALGVLIVFGSQYLVLWLGANGYLNFLLWFSPQWLPTAFLVFLSAVMVTISFLTLTFWILSVLWIVRRYFGFPTNEEMIFAESFVIAEYLTNNERLKAKGEVRFFLNVLTGFVRDFVFNPKRKVYAPEFDLLRCGKNEISRMLMFSTKDISNWFMNFGLALVRNDDSSAFSYLKQLIGEVQEYGELRGRVKRFFSGLERYPNSLPWIISIILLAIAILYYLLSGQHLPIG